MNRIGQTVQILLANLAWFASCVPGLIAFVLASFRVKRQQEAILRSILSQNAHSAWGQQHGFEGIQSSTDYQRLPLSDYEDYHPLIDQLSQGTPAVLTEEAVILLQPTSGSVSATKRIPYTASLRQQFKAALDPWMGWVYLRHPSLLLGRHYWSISPSTKIPPPVGSKVPVGFAEDAEYLGVVQRRLAKTLLVMPSEISRVTDPESFQYLTLLFLVREKNLRLISVWHPSFLTILLDAMPPLLPGIMADIRSGKLSGALHLSPELRQTFESHLPADPARAEELAATPLEVPDFPACIWPRLRLISCWTEGLSSWWVDKLRRRFPSVMIQGKGLIATEGVVSFPLDESRKACAIRSHFHEFMEVQTGAIQRAWELEKNHDYRVILTTGGGLYRYPLHDVVRVTGFYHQTPCLEFVGKDNLVSDLVGEKLNAMHVEESLRNVEARLGVRFQFALLAPSRLDEQVRYVLFVQPGADVRMDYAQLPAALEAELRRNYHYHHARQLSQLQPLKVFLVAGSAEGCYQRHMIQQGMKAGDVKVYGLSLYSGWASVFQGRYVA